MSGLRGNPEAPPPRRLRSRDRHPCSAICGERKRVGASQCTHPRGGEITSSVWGGMSSCGPPPGNRVGRPCRRPLMVWSHQLRSLLRRFDSGAHGPRMTGTGVVVISPPSMRRHVAASDQHQASGLPPPGGSRGFSRSSHMLHAYAFFRGCSRGLSRSSHMLHAYAFFRRCSRGLSQSSHMLHAYAFFACLLFV